MQKAAKTGIESKFKSAETSEKHTAVRKVRQCQNKECWHTVLKKERNSGLSGHECFTQLGRDGLGMSLRWMSTKAYISPSCGARRRQRRERWFVDSGWGNARVQLGKSPAINTDRTGKKVGNHKINTRLEITFSQHRRDANRKQRMPNSRRRPATSLVRAWAQKMSGNQTFPP